MNDKFKEQLRSKIDSYEKWQAALKVSGYWPSDRTVALPQTGLRIILNDSYVGDMNVLHVKESWWMEREYGRISAGIYPAPTEVLNKLVAGFKLHQYCIHISAEDPTMLAYTASIEDGIRDKQVRVSFGKLMRKLLLVLTDTHIQQLEASHRSEMDPSFPVARTPEEVTRVYRTMRGDTGCMRYGPDQWELPSNLHPSQIYAYEGMGVAYIEVDGDIKARSVIWDNPDDPSDKRYVRLYGDSALQRKLERAGYRCRDLAGAKIKAIRLDTLPRIGSRWNENTYLVAYLDGPGGNQGHKDGRFGYMLEGEDCIRLITHAQAKRLGQITKNAPEMFATQRATVRVVPVKPELLTFTCPVSGTTGNALEMDVEHAYVDGKVVDALASAVSGWAQVYHVVNGGVAMARVKLADGELLESRCFNDQFRHGGWFLDTPENREHCGYVLLSTEFGYAPNTWAYVAETVNGNDDKVLLKKDAHYVCDADGAHRMVHVTELEELKKNKKEYTSVAPVGKHRVISHVSNPKLHTSLSGRKVVEGVHDIMEFVDGTWDFKVNGSARKAMFGTNFYRPTTMAVDTMRATEAYMRRVMGFEDWLRYAQEYGPSERARRLEILTFDTIRSGIDGYVYYTVGDALMRNSAYEKKPTNASIRKALAKLEAMTDQQIADTIYEDAVPNARLFQHHAALLVKMLDAQIAEWAAAPPAATTDAASQALAAFEDAVVAVQVNAVELDAVA